MSKKYYFFDHVCVEAYVLEKRIYVVNHAILVDIFSLMSADYFQYSSIDACGLISIFSHQCMQIIRNIFHHACQNKICILRSKELLGDSAVPMPRSSKSDAYADSTNDIINLIANFHCKIY